MASPPSTSWTLIRGAAAGHLPDRAEFALRYEPVVRAYLAARWRDGPRLPDLDDATQTALLECFREGGVLDRSDEIRCFHAFLYGVLRNLARRFEADGAGGPAEPPRGLDALPASEESLSRAFDRAWALALVREALRRQAARAGEPGSPGDRRAELLRLRFQEDLPIREIARRIGSDPAALHHEYARAREEFRETLHEVVGEEHPGTPGEVGRKCASLLALIRSPG